MQKDKYGFGIMPTIEDLSSYESPIQVTYREMQNAFDNDVLKAVLSYGISVDKDELIRALQYDRKQYEKGFADGVRVHLGEDAVPVVHGRWIHVAEQLPTEADEDVSGGVLAIERQDGLARRWAGRSVRIYPEMFTYWMPLPEAPKEEP